MEETKVGPLLIRYGMEGERLAVRLFDAATGEALGERFADTEAEVDAVLAVIAEFAAEHSEAASAPDRHVAAMLWLAPEDAAELAVPGGEKAEELHVTLTYLGKLSELPEGTVERALAALRPVIEATPPLRVHLGPLASFDDNGDGTPWFLKVSGDELFALRQRVASALDIAGVPHDRTFPVYQPHVTLAYGKRPEKSPPSREVTLRVVRLCTGKGGACEFMELKGESPSSLLDELLDAGEVKESKPLPRRDEPVSTGSAVLDDLIDSAPAPAKEERAAVKVVEEDERRRPFDRVDSHRRRKALAYAEELLERESTFLRHMRAYLAAERHEAVKEKLSAIVDNIAQSSVVLKWRGGYTHVALNAGGKSFNARAFTFSQDEEEVSTSGNFDGDVLQSEFPSERHAKDVVPLALRDSIEKLLKTLHAQTGSVMEATEAQAASDVFGITLSKAGDGRAVVSLRIDPTSLNGVPFGLDAYNRDKSLNVESFAEVELFRLGTIAEFEEAGKRQGKSKSEFVVELRKIVAKVAARYRRETLALLNVYPAGSPSWSDDASAVVASTGDSIYAMRAEVARAMELIGLRDWRGEDGFYALLRLGYGDSKPYADNLRTHIRSTSLALRVGGEVYASDLKEPDTEAVVAPSTVGGLPYAKPYAKGDELYIRSGDLIGTPVKVVRALHRSDGAPPQDVRYVVSVASTGAEFTESSLNLSPTKVGKYTGKVTITTEEGTPMKLDIGDLAVRAKSRAKEYAKERANTGDELAFGTPAKTSYAFRLAAKRASAWVRQFAAIAADMMPELLTSARKEAAFAQWEADDAEAHKRFAATVEDVNAILSELSTFKHRDTGAKLSHDEIMKRKALVESLRGHARNLKVLWRIDGEVPGPTPPAAPKDHSGDYRMVKPNERGAVVAVDGEVALGVKAWVKDRSEHDGLRFVGAMLRVIELDTAEAEKEAATLHERIEPRRLARAKIRQKGESETAKRLIDEGYKSSDAGYLLAIRRMIADAQQSLRGEADSDDFVTLYRGLTGDQAREFRKAYAAGGGGLRIPVDRVVSFTTTNVVAESFGDRGSAVMTARVPRGAVVGCYMGDHPANRELADRGEREVLVATNGFLTVDVGPGPTATTDADDFGGAAEAASDDFGGAVDDGSGDDFGGAVEASTSVEDSPPVPTPTDDDEERAATVSLVNSNGHMLYLESDNPHPLTWLLMLSSRFISHNPTTISSPYLFHDVTEEDGRYKLSGDAKRYAEWEKAYSDGSIPSVSGYGFGDVDRSTHMRVLEWVCRLLTQNRAFQYFMVSADEDKRGPIALSSVERNAAGEFRIVLNNGKTRGKGIYLKVPSPGTKAVMYQAGPSSEGLRSEGGGAWEEVCDLRYEPNPVPMLKIEGIGVPAIASTLDEIWKASKWKQAAKRRALEAGHIQLVQIALRNRWPLRPEVVKSHPYLAELYPQEASAEDNSPKINPRQSDDNPDVIVKHSAEEGTTIRTTADGEDRRFNEAIKGLRMGFKWWREGVRWYRNQSRGQREPTVSLVNIAQALRAAGARVAIEFEDVGAERARQVFREHKEQNAERAIERAEAKAEKARELLAQAAAAADRARTGNTARRRRIAEGMAERLQREARQAAGKAEALADRAVRNQKIASRGAVGDKLARARAVEESVAPVRSRQSVMEGVADFVRASESGKKEFGFFATPQWLAEKMASLAGIEPGRTVLEPSAGMGSLVDAALARGGKVTAVELQADRYDYLKKHAPSAEVIRGEFVESTEEGGELHGRQFDVVLMNPPFALPDEPRAFVSHFWSAVGLLKQNRDDGSKACLVMIAPSSLTYVQSSDVAEMRTWLQVALKDQNGAEASIEPLPEGTFKGAGTGVNAVLVVLRLP